ncbi:hypothetical protein CK203_035725 [Vitis vinifera]|uniref:SWIM-type domain-containing protein n=1 Tax=Vitis vinifera TaxID=29760 RepID=A0A438ICJ9_VITVI|nr:hypothetical protein CK203_035725 [Vitis vinifera]
MDPNNTIYCYLHIGGELVRDEHGNVEYMGGRQEGLSLERSMTYNDFVSRICGKMNINIVGPTFSYTLPFDLYALQPLKNDEDLINMFQFSDRCARVYICLASTVEDDETIENGGQGLNETIVGSNSPVPYSTRDVDIRMQSRGFHQRCAKSHVGPLESSRFESAILGSGHTFSTANEFRDAIYLMMPLESNCSCCWENKNSSMHTFRNEHNHSLEDVSISEPVVRCNRATAMIDDVICSNPDYLPRQICKDFRRQYGMQLNYCQAWNLKEKAKERIHGVPQCSYKLLPWLCTRLIETNPGTIAEYRCLDDGHFMQLFVALSVSIHGFQLGCRPIISIDSSHMSGPYKGALFSASSYDADDGMFPLAYGLFSSENYEDWLWFLEKLKMVIGERDVIIISDRHQGLSIVFQRKGKENALQMLDSIAYARLDCDYEVAMDTLRTFNHDLAKWVEENNPQHWAISKFKKMRWDKMTRSLLVEHKNGLVKWNGCIGPKTKEKIALKIGKGENYITYLHLGSSMKVSNGKAFLEVDLMERTCTCKAWQMSGIPCDHACAAIRRMGFDVSDYVDDWYKYNLQEKIYSGSMRTLVTHDMPMIDEDGTVRDALGHTYPFFNPPTTKRPLGRPRKRRIES